MASNRKRSPRGWRLTLLLLAAWPRISAAVEAAVTWEPLFNGKGPADDATLAEADQALRDTFTLQGLQGVAARRPDGGFDWSDRGPRDDPEWAWFFNRQRYFTATSQAYLRTLDDRYAEFTFATLDDWIRQHPAPGRMSFSAAWRPLEAARRILDSWTFVYLQLGAHPAFTPERRARFVASVHAHGEQLRHHHALAGNHLITEMLALAQLSLVFPADAAAGEWLDYSLEKLECAYAEQVYPDGTHTELSAHYQRGVALVYQRLVTLLETAGRKDLADVWRPRVDSLWAYLAAVMQPSGANPLNNDSDQENLTLTLREHAPELAAGDQRSHWFPYAGQALFRSRSSAADATLWAFFDAGPRGTDHDHADRLHLSVSIGTREFLVDNGRYTYRPGPWRDYFAGPSGHNIVLFDGKGSDQGPQKVGQSGVLGRFFAQGNIELAYGDTGFAAGDNPRAGDWRRVVIHLREVGWLVVDRLVAFQPVELSTLWHWSPACDALPADETRGQVIRLGAGALRIQVASSASAGNWQVVRGSSQPIQGWYSDRFNFKTPASCTVFTQRLAGPMTNVWLLTPSEESREDTRLAVDFKPTGKLGIRVRAANLERQLEFDPEHPEAVNGMRSTVEYFSRRPLASPIGANERGGT